jgi:hypothetical protein
VGATPGGVAPSLTHRKEHIMTSSIAARRGRTQRHPFGFDQIMATPNYRRFNDWYARTSFFAPGRAEVEAVLSRPEAGFDKAA